MVCVVVWLWLSVVVLNVLVGFGVVLSSLALPSLVVMWCVCGDGPVGAGGAIGDAVVCVALLSVLPALSLLLVFVLCCM